MELLAAITNGLDFVEHEYNTAQVGHCKRVALVSALICRELGLSRDEIFDMVACAMLHDSALTLYRRTVGPVGMQEYRDLEFHCRGGEEFARAFPFRGEATGIVLAHHERWDGGGPFGMKGTEIPLRGAVLALADSLDVRVGGLGRGNPSYGSTRARQFVEEQRGSQYAPGIADVFLRLCTPSMMEDLGAERLNSALHTAVEDFSTEMELSSIARLCTVFMNIIDAKSTSTAHHSTGIAHTVEKYAHHMGFSEAHTLKLKIAAQLHDVGKLLTPSALLEKPGKLTPEEFVVMKQHAQGSVDILSPIHGMDDIISWAVSHHEKLDGSGYPRGLKGDELSFECRLMTCMDIYQALTENRVYRAGLPHERAMAILHELVDTGKIDGTIVGQMETCLAG